MRRGRARSWKSWMWFESSDWQLLLTVSTTSAKEADDTEQDGWCGWFQTAAPLDATISPLQNEPWSVYWCCLVLKYPSTDQPVLMNFHPAAREFEQMRLEQVMWPSYSWAAISAGELLRLDRSAGNCKAISAGNSTPLDAIASTAKKCLTIPVES